MTCCGFAAAFEDARNGCPGLKDNAKPTSETAHSSISSSAAVISIPASSQDRCRPRHDVLDLRRLRPVSPGPWSEPVDLNLPPIPFVGEDNKYCFALGGGDLVELTNDGWYKAGGGDLSWPLKKPNEGSAISHHMALSDDFSRPI